MMELITPHRRALAEALAGLSTDQWSAPTLCTGWTPGHVLAHLTMPYRISEQDFMQGLQRCGGDFTRFSDEIAENDSKIPQAELVGVLAGNAETPWAPPGGGLIGALSHDVIHGLDTCWPLRLEYPIADQAMTTVLGAMAGSGEQTPFGVPTAGLEFRATDLGWSSGQGALVSGSSRDLLMLLTGRAVPAELFSGPAAALVAVP
jgi:uncharacterized protein (TIGR03083 family)